ncbi:MAG: polysaccharide deacetylase family protein [Chloroflexi bacterium]|nr:polysaccharide deacetylase family protein [Chloroflexota bacterium]
MTVRIRPHENILLSPTALSVAEQFSQALQRSDWSVMWSLLHPLQQHVWGSESDYAHFLAAKFTWQGASLISSVSLGTASVDQHWGNVRFTSEPLLVTEVPMMVGLPHAHALNPLDPSQDASPVVLTLDSGVWKVIDPGIAGAEGTILLPPHPPYRQLHVPILMYHHVGPPVVHQKTMTNFDFRLATDLTVPVEHFAQQLSWLNAHGFHTISLQHLFASLYDSAPLPPHPIVLSFDDGYLDNYTDAFPLLQRYHMVGTFNIISHLPGLMLGTNTYMTWSQIQALSAAGMDIESHTVYHVDLGQLSATDALNELTVSRQTIGEHIGHLPQIICYPSGEPFRSESQAAQQRVLSLVEQAGYMGGLLDPKIAGNLEDSSHPQLLPRIRIAGQITPIDYERLIEYFSR